MSKQNKLAGKCVNCGGVELTKDYRCIDCRKKTNLARKQRFIDNPKDAICDVCGGNDWNDYGDCKPCRNQKTNLKRAIQREKYNNEPKDIICHVCGDNHWNNLGWCQTCATNTSREYKKRLDRVCSREGCDNLCNAGYGYCPECATEYSREHLKKPDRKCGNSECLDFAAVGTNYCNFHSRENRKTRLLRDDRKCPHCENICPVGAEYCRSCTREKARQLKAVPDRPCPTDGCENVCKIGASYCAECKSQYDRDYRNKANKSCNGWNCECDRICEIGYTYCMDCHNSKSHDYRAKKKLAEGSHNGLDISKLRDLFEGQCLECILKNDFLSDDTPHMDHIQSLHNGGSNGVYNLQPLCDRHNKSKGAKNIRYIESCLIVLDISIDDYLDIIGISHSEYEHILKWWDKLETNENKRFEWK